MRLERDGVPVIGVDLRDATVTADLATPAGRSVMLAGVEAAAGGALAGVVACAGLGPHVDDRPRVASVNYFGAVALLDGLRSRIAPGGAAVAVSSNSSTLPNAESPLVAACLDGDEAAARRLAAEMHGASVYAGAKRALTLWLRRQAPTWAGGGVRLNAVAPGPIRTPLLEGTISDPILGPALRDFPVPLGGFGTPEQAAEAIAFLLGPGSAFCAGSVLFVDGGTDALLRPDTY